jgi:hypothetical protein
VVMPPPGSLRREPRNDRGCVDLFWIVAPDLSPVVLVAHPHQSLTVGFLGEQLMIMGLTCSFARLVTLSTLRVLPVDNARA